ncbi:unnamed protein product [Linum tenue]|uniref:Uncharacterized protein n=1 Tax=Linum tenue TaxID=586396 RepID=A0AAV0KJV2_9ROSI|nr:unnamed protein product [Linum tenue]
MTMIRSFTAHDGPVTAIVLCMGISQPTVVSCSTDSTCKLWSLLEGTNLRTVAFPCPISGIALDPSETDLYAAGSDGSVYHGVLNMKAGNKERPIDYCIAWKTLCCRCVDRSGERREEAGIPRKTAVFI